MGSYEAKRLLNVAEDAPFEQATTMSENRMGTISEVTWKSSNPTKRQAASTPISRANSDLSLYTPVRRRSIIQTPGVATRARESPAPSLPNFRYSHPPTPSLSRMQSFESTRSVIVSMPPRLTDEYSVPRVVTPCEDDYQSIGAYKLGSLRITNGAASPGSPEPGKSHRREEMDQDASRHQVDYFTQSPVLASQGEAGWTPGDKGYAASESSVGIQSPRPLTLDLSPIAVSFQDAVSGKDKSDSGSIVKDLSPNITEVTQAIPEYLAEIAFSPFSLLDSRPASPELQTTSKHTALEDQLFEEDGHPEYSTVETLDVRLDPNARSMSEEVTDDSKTRLEHIARTDSGFVSTASPSSEYSHRPLTKADSGYGSNVSLRSFNNSKQSMPENEFSQSLDQKLMLTKSKFASSESNENPPRSPVVLTSNELAMHPPVREAPPPPVPPKDYIARSPSKANGSGMGKSLHGSVRAKESRLSSLSMSRQSRHTPSPILSLRSSDSVQKSPVSSPKTPLSAKSDTSTSALSIGSGSHKPTKLQRLLSSARRSSNGPPMVHATHALDKTAIPSIPRDVETKLREHNGLFPTAAKRLALKPQLSRDTLKTIFSVDSFEQSLDALAGVPSVPTVAEMPSDETTETKDPPRKHAVLELPAPIAHAAAHLFSGKPITRKPVPTRHLSLRERELPRDAERDANPPVEAELISYNSLNNILGDNAYDAALKAMADGQHAYFSPTKPGRTMSLTSSSDRNWNIRKMPHKSKSSTSLADPGIAYLPSPLLPRELDPPKRLNAPPPVSMMTRRPMSLRVPPSLRQQPAHADPAQQALSRKASREEIHSYPSSNGPTLTRKVSRESYPPFQQAVALSVEEMLSSPPPIPPQNPRRSLSLHRPQQYAGSQQMAPNWEVQVDHDFSGRSNRSSSDHGGRANSLSSSQSHNGRWVQRPSSAQAYRAPPSAPPPLRHRSSHDDFGRSQRSGFAPSMSNGYTAPPPPQLDPWTSHQFGPASQQLDQYGRYPYVPRGHHRNRSVGNGYGNPGVVPYRVLHSYNSPAYRHVPIWG